MVKDSTTIEYNHDIIHDRYIMIMGIKSKLHYLNFKRKRGIYLVCYHKLVEIRKTGCIVILYFQKMKHAPGAAGHHKTVMVSVIFTRGRKCIAN